jgi:hypothetical protein
MGLIVVLDHVVHVDVIILLSFSFKLRVQLVRVVNLVARIQVKLFHLLHQTVRKRKRIPLSRPPGDNPLDGPIATDPAGHAIDPPSVGIGILWDQNKVRVVLFQSTGDTGLVRTREGYGEATVSLQILQLMKPAGGYPP